MNLQALVTAVEKLIADCGPIAADVEAIVAACEAVQAGKMEALPMEANGQILASLMAMLKQFANNPVVQQIILALISGLIKVPLTPAPATPTAS